MDTEPNPLADPETLYDRHVPGLVDYAVEELHVPRAEAEELAANVLLASLRQLATIPDLAVWLRAAMTFAVRGKQCWSNFARTIGRYSRMPSAGCAWNGKPRRPASNVS